MQTSRTEQSKAAPDRKSWWSRLRIVVLLISYSLVLVGCRWLAYQLRFDFSLPADADHQLHRHWTWVICLQLTVLALFGQFSGLIRYFGLRDLYRLTLATIVSGMLFYLIRFTFGSFYSPPRGVILLQVLLSIGILAAMRLGYRLLHERRWTVQRHIDRPVERVAIMGAGDVGSGLVLEMDRRPGMAFKPIVFLDDNPGKWGSSLHGIPVVGPPESLKKYVAEYNLSRLIIAMPSAPARRVAEVTRLAHASKLNCVTVPSIDQLTSGQVTVNQLRPVSIEDLLGREPICLESESIRQSLEGKVVMVTGAGGSIGSELCRQIAQCGPSSLLLLEQCEVQLFQIEQEMIGRGHGQMLAPLAANIRDGHRMQSIFDRYRPSVVFHAAAHKHVPLMEQQPAEAVRNNSVATARLADMAVAFGVERFVMISTDKAVNPTSVMGASKRLAEIYIHALFARNPGGTKFMCVRFGNVLGSSGSVVPTFTKQIAAGGPVTVTHPDMVRYFMTIPEAVGLVLQSCSQGEGGEIFVLDMGKQIRIADLARQMIELSGLRPGMDIEIKFTGPRPGEKLYEELRCQGENYLPTRHPRIMSFRYTPEPLNVMRREFGNLEGDLLFLEPAAAKRRIQRLVPEYHPHFEPGQNPPAPEPAWSIREKFRILPLEPQVAEPLLEALAEA